MLSFEIVFEGTYVERLIDLAIASFAHVEERSDSIWIVNKIDSQDGEDLHESIARNLGAHYPRH